jgi:hypothetical protein
MPKPSPSEFHRALDARLRAAMASAETDTNYVIRRAHGLGGILDSRPHPRPESSEPAADLLARIYADELGSRPPQEMQQWEPAEVADQLRLTSDLTSDELNRIRRAFALANHPDRVAPSQRALATRRMTIANALIDAALRASKATP